MNKIVNISVQDISKVGLAQIASSSTFFSIFPKIFMICVKVHFALKMAADL